MTNGDMFVGPPAPIQVPLFSLPPDVDPESRITEEQLRRITEVGGGDIPTTPTPITVTPTPSFQQPTRRSRRRRRRAPTPAPTTAPGVVRLTVEEPGQITQVPTFVEEQRRQQLADEARRLGIVQEQRRFATLQPTGLPSRFQMRNGVLIDIITGQAVGRGGESLQAFGERQIGIGISGIQRRFGQEGVRTPARRVDVLQESVRGIGGTIEDVLRVGTGALVSGVGVLAQQVAQPIETIRGLQEFGGELITRPGPTLRSTLDISDPTAISSFAGGLLLGEFAFAGFRGARAGVKKVGRVVEQFKGDVVVRKAFERGRGDFPIPSEAPGFQPLSRRLLEKGVEPTIAGEGIISRAETVKQTQLEAKFFDPISQLELPSELRPRVVEDPFFRAQIEPTQKQLPIEPTVRKTEFGELIVDVPRPKITPLEEIITRSEGIGQQRIPTFEELFVGPPKPKVPPSEITIRRTETGKGIIDIKQEVTPLDKFLFADPTGFGLTTILETQRIFEKVKSKLEIPRFKPEELTRQFVEAVKKGRALPIIDLTDLQTFTKQEVTPISKQLQDITQLQKQITIQDVTQVQETIQQTQQAQRQRQRQVQEQIQEQAQAQELISIQELETLLDTTPQIKRVAERLTRPLRPARLPKPRRVITPAFIPRPRFDFSQDFTINPGFDTFVKRTQAKLGKGKFRSRGFQKVNVKPLTRRGAFVRGAQIVDKFTNRSFFTKPAGKPAVSGFQDEKFNELFNKFRPSKKDPNIFVEKSQFAIDSKEEKEGIPFKAQRERKAKRSIKTKSFEDQFFSGGLAL